MSQVWKESDRAATENRKRRMLSFLGKATLFVLAAILAGMLIAPYTRGEIRGYTQPACMGPGETLERTFLRFGAFNGSQQREAYRAGFRSYRNKHGDCLPLMGES